MPNMVTITNELIEIHPKFIGDAYNKGEAKKVLKAIKDMVSAASREYNMDKKEDRADCASLAHKITRSRTLLEKAGSSMVKEAKQSIVDKVESFNKTKILFTDALNNLRQEVRKPLNDWEEIRSRWDTKVKHIQSLAAITPDTPIHTIENSLQEALKSSDTFYGVPDEMLNEYLGACAATVKILEAAKVTILAHDKDKKELEMFRKQREDQEKREQQGTTTEEENAPLKPVGELTPVGEIVAASKVLDSQPVPDTLHEALGPDVAPSDLGPSQEFQDEPETLSKLSKGQINSRIVKHLIQHCPISEPTAKSIVTEVALGKVKNLYIKY